MLIYLLLPHSPVPPALPCAMPSQFCGWPSGFKFGSSQVDPQCKKIGSIWVGLVGYNWPNCPVHRAQQTGPCTLATPLIPLPSSAGSYVALCQPELVQNVHHIQSNWKVFQSNRFFFYLCQICKAPATPILPPVLTLRYANPSCMRVGAKRPPHSIT